MGAQVMLHRDGEPDKQEVSGNNGEYSFAHVPSGPFHLTITAQGFKAEDISGVLQAGEFYIAPLVALAVSGGTTEVSVGLSPAEVAQEQIHEEEKQRVLGIVPNFYVTYDPDAAPLNAKQKFELAWKVAIDPITFVGAGVLAGFEQAGDRYPGYGQGFQGYAKRYGGAYANAMSGIFIGNALMPALFKQDPRYFYRGTGSTRSRLFYALASPVMCKGDNKRWEPNYSFITGSIAVGGLSNLYVPASDRNGAGIIFQNALIRIGQGSLGGILQEFVVRLFTRRGDAGHPDKQ